MTRKWTINGPLLSKLLKKNLHYVFPSTFSLRRSPDSPFSCPFGQDTTIRKVFPHLSASTQCRLSATTTCRLLLPLEHSFFRVYYTVLPGSTTHRIYRRVFAGKSKSINLKSMIYVHPVTHHPPWNWWMVSMQIEPHSKSRNWALSKIKHFINCVLKGYYIVTPLTRNWSKRKEAMLFYKIKNFL